MNIYVFGNEDFKEDSLALKVSKKIQNKFPRIKFIFVKPNEDLPFANKNKVYILDVVSGIKKITIFEEKDIIKLKIPPRSTVHDFDLAFQIKYLIKIGKLKKIKILGLPANKNINYKNLISSFKKFVAQDMHGS